MTTTDTIFPHPMAAYVAQALVAYEADVGA